MTIIHYAKILAFSRMEIYVSKDAYPVDYWDGGISYL